MKASPGASRSGSVLRTLLRVGVAVGLTGYLLWTISPRAILASGLDWRFVVAAAVLVLADRALMAYRWIRLLCTVDQRQRPPLGAVLRVFFLSTFVGTFLPTVGGDLFRGYQLSRLNVSGGDALASVVMDRMLGVASILVMSLLGLFLVRELASTRAVVLALGAGGLVCAATIAVIFVPGAARVASAAAARVPGIGAELSRTLQSMQKYSAHRRDLASVLLCSIGVQAIRILQAYLLGRGLGLEAGLTVYLAFVPLILLVMLVPITFNGLGTSQVAFVFFFSRAGVPDSGAFALSVLFVALGVLGNLPGALLYVTRYGAVAPAGHASTIPTGRRIG